MFDATKQASLIKNVKLIRRKKWKYFIERRYFLLLKEQIFNSW